VLAEVEQLLELQGIDERLADATARIGRLQTEAERLRLLIEKEGRSVASAREALSHLQHQSRMRNLEVDELDMQIRNYQRRLEQGIISFKEMEDLRTKITSERSRIDQLEDEALTMMDSIEETARETREAETRFAEREQALLRRIAETEKQSEATRAQLSELQAIREAAVERTSSYLVSHYESLHKRYANPVAEIRNGTCTGCKLRVSGNTAERARGEMGVVTCEHCSRVLYTA
jgi:predicted  nucleic acid-binding Zn-ribbon protein